MFIVDSHEMKSVMFPKSTKANSEIELWHKRIGHTNLNKLKAMQSKGVIIELPKFKEKEIEGVSKACQFGKQHQHPFPKERNMSRGLLDVIHSDVWGPTQTSTFGGCRYYVLFIDDFYMHTWIYPMRNKKRSDTSKNSKVKLKKARVVMYDAFNRMAAMSISQTTLQRISERKEFGENSLADTLIT